MQQTKTCLFFDGIIYYKKQSHMSKRNFLKEMGVKTKTYIGNVIERLYDYYCKHSINLYSDYKKYYNNEFETFEDYLEKKHNLTSDEIKILNNKKSFFNVYSNSPEKYKIESLFGYDQEDNEIKTRFLKFMGDCKNEN